MIKFEALTWLSHFFSGPSEDLLEGFSFQIERTNLIDSQLLLHSCSVKWEDLA
jgi:hypothetical protein